MKAFKKRDNRFSPNDLINFENPHLDQGKDVELFKEDEENEENEDI